jgi:hypothetical protein
MVQLKKKATEISESEEQEREILALREISAKRNENEREMDRNGTEAENGAISWKNERDS